MIGYICKYTPIEVISAFGEEAVYIEGENCDGCEGCMHPNMCSYAKNAESEIKNSGANQMFFVNCCDSIKRLYDACGVNVDFSFMGNVPRKNDEFSAEFYADEIKRFIKEYSQFLNKEFDLEKFVEILNENISSQKGKDYILLAGARATQGLINSLEKNCVYNVKNVTCSGIEREFGGDFNGSFDDVIFEYAKALLNMNPCMRMSYSTERKKLYSDEKIKGIIYHNIKFCDFYGFEEMSVRNFANAPYINIETDGSGENEQLKTRINAFYEANGMLKENEICEKKEYKYFMGIDCGSTTVNGVLGDKNGEILAYYMTKTGAQALLSIEEVKNNLLAKVNCGESDVKILYTGYGRDMAQGVSSTEITCHAKGAKRIFKNVGTVIDIGGQDSKIIKLDEKGDIADFYMNDKCAAGTGKFLELMAATLQLSLDEFSALAHKSTQNITLSSMCSVFAESEVIGLIAKGNKKEDIVRAIDMSVAKRLGSVAKRMNCKPPFVITGGVSKNSGVIAALEKIIGHKISSGEFSQYCGAVGAMLIAL